MRQSACWSSLWSLTLWQCRAERGTNEHSKHDMAGAMGLDVAWTGEFRSLP
jgi:hypothetical protein